MKEFLSAVQEAAQAFPKKGSVRIVAHYDADGIAAASILSATMQALKLPHAVRFLMRLEEEHIEEISRDHANTIVLADIGAEYANILTKTLSHKHLLILDHHPSTGSKHLNPTHFGLNSEALSGAGVAYAFCKSLWPGVKAYAHLAAIGMIADRQTPSESHNLFLADANISSVPGIAHLGVSSRSLAKALSSCDAYPLRGEDAAQFLLASSLDPTKRVDQLTEEERLHVAEALSVLTGATPSSLLTTYLVLNQKNELGLREAKSFATMLNACGKLGKASIGMGACLGNAEMQRLGLQCLADYQKEIMTGKLWMRTAGKAIQRGQGYAIIDATRNVRAELLGVVCSILQKEERREAVLGLADHGKHLKVSLRTKELNATKLLQDILQELGGSSNGHRKAAGGYLHAHLRSQVKEKAERVLSRESMEEFLQ